MQKIFKVYVCFFVGLFFSTQSLSGIALGRLIDLDRELVALAADRDRGVVLDQAGLYRFEFLRAEVRAEAGRLGEMFPGAIQPELQAFLDGLDARYPRVEVVRPAGAEELVHMNPAMRPAPLAERVDRGGAIDAAERPVQDRGLRDWVGEHPVATTCIVIGGVTVIGLTVDVIVNGKRSVIGKLFYKDESEENLQKNLKREELE